MLLIVTAMGIVGSIVLGLRGIGAGPAGELDRILAIGFVLMAAAGALGTLIDDGQRDADRPVMTREEGFQLLMAIPIVLLMIGVFLVTLTPSIYVMLPFFAVWHQASRPRPEEHVPTTTHGAPSYAH